MTGTIYKITSPSGRIYIGQTKNFNSRMSDHKNPQWSNKNTIIARSVKKHGWDAHKVDIVVEISNCNKKLLNDLESHYVRLYCSFADWSKAGMNLTTGGDQNNTPSELTKEKLRKINLGKKHKQSSIDKMISSRTGTKLSEEWKGNISKGHKNSELKAKQERSINVYDKEMNFLYSIKSLRETARSFDIGMSSIFLSCKSQYNTAKGYVFRYADEEQIPFKTKPRKDSLKVVQKDYGGNTINEFKNVHVAIKSTGFKGLYHYINGDTKDDYGFIWEVRKYDNS